VAVVSDQELRVDFFKFLFGSKRGYICIATDAAVKGDFKQRFFQWPTEESAMLTHIAKARHNRNVWFCVNLLKRKDRGKEACLAGNLLWADLDECPPDIIEPHPQVVIESSPERYQAIWLVDEELEPQIAEDYSRRIYTQYKDNGVDSGWALGKLLRVPYTYNLKYDSKPLVTLNRTLNALLPPELFEALTKTPDIIAEDEGLPELQDADEIIARHFVQLREHHFSGVWGYEATEDDDWSGLLWNLIHICFEAGLTTEETYSVASASTLNKYRRDNRPARYLWRDVTKAAKLQEGLNAFSRPFDMPELIPGERYKLGQRTFVEEYAAWGREATDACPQYHDLTAFMLLSSLLAGNIKLETSYGKIRPNLWGLILGDSTLTRKSTAMRMGMDVIDFIDRDILLATDGSVEGLLSGLQGRPGRTSMFFRDEIVGFFDSIRKKDYLAGMPQMLTQLYDGGYIARRLRKELITVSDPIFIFFGGGIKDQMYTAVEESFVYSGFLPRFLIVSGNTDLNQYRAEGPPTPEIIEKRQKIYNRLHNLYHNYVAMKDVEILGETAQMPQDVEAVLTKDAWKLYNEIERRVIEAATLSPNPSLILPTFERLVQSMRKMAVLIAASSHDPADGNIEVGEKDIRRSAKYAQEWGNYTIEVLLNIGQTVAQRKLDRALTYIVERPGVTRSAVMRALNLSKREMQEIEETLDARGQLQVASQGRARLYTAL